MKIQFNPQYNFNGYNKPINQNKANLDCKKESLSFSKPSFENIKANFMPSFGKFKNVGQAIIKDRQTNRDVVATIKKEKYSDNYVTYQLYAKREFLGFMDLIPYSDIPNTVSNILIDNGYIPCQNAYPEIFHIRTVAGDKYSGIGSTLIKLAIEESKKRGMDGVVWLHSEKGYQRYVSPYRSNENPIPFYHKMGFVTTKRANERIKEIIKSEDYSDLPIAATLVLPPENIEANPYLEKNYELK